MSKKIWEAFYKNNPLDKIPWQKTQADWFHELLQKGEIKGESTLDLGCGTGMKSIELAKQGFSRIVGVDISLTAITYAKKNANDEKVSDKVKFYCQDATDLSFLGKEKFDFILDWANLHGLSKIKRTKYISEIVKHTKPKSQLLLRCFSKRGTKKKNYFEVETTGMKNRIYLFSKKDIEKLYGDYFQITKTNHSNPQTNIGFEFDEYLMQRK